MRVSRLLALAAFFGLVPAGLLVTYAGVRSGLYPASAVPLVFGVGFAAALVVLFFTLPVLRQRVG